MLNIGDRAYVDPSYNNIDIESMVLGNCQFLIDTFIRPYISLCMYVCFSVN